MKKQSKLVVLAVLAYASTLAAYRFVSKPETALRISGTIEARNIRVGSKTGGRIERVLVNEGDRVQAGQILFTFDRAELNAALAQGAARVARARASLDRLRNGYRSEEIAEARAVAEQASAALKEATSGYRAEEVAQSVAERYRARVEEANAKATYERYDDLLRDEAISRQQRDDAKARWDQARAMLDKASQHVVQLQGGYRRETIDAAASRLRQAEAAVQRLESGYRSEEIAGARAELAQAEAEQTEIEARLREMEIKAPADAIVEVLDARPGDLIAPNTPAATLLERGQLYVRVYVPETKLGLVRAGQTAEVSVDTFPGQTFPAQVEQVNQKAEFLPRNVQTHDTRALQVFGLKLRIEDGASVLRAGMAADVQLRLTEK
jgi:multidrug resistance efflux pump